MTAAESGIRHAHTNLMANNWTELQDFDVQVFACETSSAERDHKGPAFEALTGSAGASFRGRHLRLPGHGERGPTLEIVQSSQSDPRPSPSLFRPGFAQVAFEVPDVESKRQEVLRWGGREVGQLVTLDIPGAGKLTLIYVTDPEGNIVELQRWHCTRSSADVRPSTTSRMDVNSLRPIQSSAANPCYYDPI